MVRRFARERQRFRTTGRTLRCRAMHIEIRAYFATFLLEQHREQKPGPKPATRHSQETRAATWLELAGRAPVLREQISPHHHVPVFDVGEASVDVLLLRVGLGGG